MPRRRRFRGRRRRRYRRFGRRRFGMSPRLVMALNEGHQHKSIDWSTVPIPTTGNFNHITSIASGDGSAQRDGTRIVPRNLSIRMVIAKHASAVATEVAIALIRVKKDISATGFLNANLNEVFDTADGVPHAFRELNNLYNYDVIWRKIVLLNAQYPSRLIYKFTRFPPHQVKYDNTGTGDVTQGALWLVGWSNEGTNKPTTTILTRFKYIR